MPVRATPITKYKIGLMIILQTSPSEI